MGVGSTDLTLKASWEGEFQRWQKGGVRWRGLREEARSILGVIVSESLLVATSKTVRLHLPA